MRRKKIINVSEGEKKEDGFLLPHKKEEEENDEIRDRDGGKLQNQGKRTLLSHRFLFAFLGCMGDDGKCKSK